MDKNKQNILLFFLFAFSSYCALIIGQSWDEGFHLMQGKITLEYLFSFGRQNEIFIGREYYSPIYWSLQYLITEIFPPQFSTEISHLVNLLFSFCTILGLSKITKELFNKSVAKIVFIFLFFYPIFFGHMSFNPKDTILAFSHVWITYLTLRYIKKQYSKNKKIKYLFFLGLTAATGTGIQLVFLGSLLPLFLFLLCEIFIFKKIISSNFNRKKFFYDLIIVFFFFYLILILFWLDAHQNIFLLPIKFITNTLSNNFTGFVTGYPYNIIDGQYFLSNEVPKIYFLKFIFYKSPEYFLLSYLFFLFFIFNSRKFFVSEFNSFYYKTLWIISLLIYPSAILYLSPFPIYDGIRLFYWSLPYFSILPGIAVYFLIKNLKYLYVKFCFSFLLLLFTFLIYNFFIITPYHYAYSNIFSGKNVDNKNKYENDYWGTSIKELISKIEFNKDEIIKISTCGVNPKISKKYFKKYGYTAVEFVSPEQSDYMIMTNRTFFDTEKGKISNCFNVFKGEDIYLVTRNKLILSTVRKIN